MRRSILLWFLSAAVLFLFMFSAPAQANVLIENAERIDSIVLTVSPSYGSIDELTDSVTAIHPNVGTVRTRTIRQKDGAIQARQLFVAQSEDLTALVSSLIDHDFFGLPEHLETDILDGDFTWVTVTLQTGESKRVGGLWRGNMARRALSPFAMP